MTRLVMVVVALVAFCWLASVALAGVEPPLVVLHERRLDARTPDGTVVPLPAGTEVAACADGRDVAIYEVDSRTFRVLRPCTQDDVFRDGFEVQP